MDIDPPGIFTVVVYFLLVWVLPLLVGRLLVFLITRNSGWRPTKKRKWLWAALLAVIWATYPWFVVVEDINGRVVDVNGQPLEGVLVTAKWSELYRIPRIGLHDYDYLVTDLINAMESVTDADGRYHFPGFFYVSPILRRMSRGSPDVGFYKEGLRADYNVTVYPKNSVSFEIDLLRDSVLNDISVVMVEMDTDYQRRGSSGVLWGFIKYVLRDDSCLWANIPNAFVYEYKSSKNGVRIAGDLVKLSIIDEPKSMKQCGVDLSYFEGLNEWNIRFE
ncbi:MAG: carboxypeptidase-like regulatory domain-containing protein [Xanthomonadales bacterium]|nr:carboxypeptidase-like regulatory domain-containing protein [Xanthomonadales bacterium]